MTARGLIVRMLAPAIQPEPAAASPADGWRAELAVTLAPRRGRTRVVARRHAGPLVVQRALYPAGEPCHLLMLHPPGGLVGLDSLLTDLTLAPGAEALVTAPGAAKVYRNDERQSTSAVSLRVADGAALEWLPHETIVFDGAHGLLTTRLELAAQSRFVGWELLCLGRPACGERFARGALEQDVECVIDGRLHHAESWRLTGDSAALTAPWGLAGRPVFATLMAWRVDTDTLVCVREAAASATDLDAGATCIDGLLVLRVLGPATEPVRALLEQTWNILRRPVIGRAPRRPRIWNT